MSQRGRGLLELKKTNNPFFQTTTATDLGVNPREEIEWKGDIDPSMVKCLETSNDTFSFLYTRESDTIGARVPKSATTKLGVMTKTEFLRKRREELKELGYGAAKEIGNTESATAEKILEVYRHVPNIQDPRFVTETNEYGKKPPTIATLVTDRMARQQGFSNSFNNIKPKNSSMNTAITKSTVHPKLDPQFL